jgi:hypothetical protein
MRIVTNKRSLVVKLSIYSYKTVIQALLAVHSLLYKFKEEIFVRVRKTTQIWSLIL